jgi:hypothetical protein
MTGPSFHDPKRSLDSTAEIQGNATDRCTSPDEVGPLDVVVGDVVVWCDRQLPVVAVGSSWRRGGKWEDITVLERGREFTLHYRDDEKVQVIR